MENKIELAQRYSKELIAFRDIRDEISWNEGRIFFILNEYKLFGPISKKAFYNDLNIPISTVAFKERLYSFYIVKHRFEFEEVAKANTKKLHRAIPFIEERTKEQVKKVIKLAEQKNQSLADFLKDCCK